MGREENQQKAKTHYEKMEHLFFEETAKSVRESRIYSPDSAFSASEKIYSPIIRFDNIDSVSAVQKYSNTEFGKTALLNFASYKHPGGKFLDGSMAQEEAICHKSNLYNILSRLDSYYAWNKLHLNRALYTNRAVYSPDVVFEEGATCDVITCAAPNRSVIRYGMITEEENEAALLERTKFMYEIAEENGVNTLILGAWGCGVFRQNPEVVLKHFLNESRNRNFVNLIFAVPGTDRNAKVFSKIVKK